MIERVCFLRSTTKGSETAKCKEARERRPSEFVPSTLATPREQSDSRQITAEMTTRDCATAAHLVRLLDSLSHSSSPPPYLALLNYAAVRSTPLVLYSHPF